MRESFGKTNGQLEGIPRTCETEVQRSTATVRLRICFTAATRDWGGEGLDLWIRRGYGTMVTEMVQIWSFEKKSSQFNGDKDKRIAYMRILIYYLRD
ncbi:hypothetical protein E2542_SST05369 [Spatholobus suberectus]|nr:hypothetical protein E2542_SST05369 [Spatholobus suberectus]